MSIFKKGKQSKKIPLSPDDLIRRMKDVPKIIEWSRKKHLIVEGPELGGFIIFSSRMI
jgi:hypothetical protein